MLTTEEARALYKRVRDMSLPSDDYAIVLRAIKKLGNA